MAGEGLSLTVILGSQHWNGSQKTLLVTTLDHGLAKRKMDGCGAGRDQLSKNPCCGIQARDRILVVVAKWSTWFYLKLWKESLKLCENINQE